MKKRPIRQIHLDFHTSGYINDIGSAFDKKEFQRALIEGHVDSVITFGKCHHGYFYYPTEVGTVHPGLNLGFDLTKNMMDACHEIGVKAPLYLTLGWSALDAKEHPEWIARNKDGSYRGFHYDFSALDDEVKEESSWVELCSAGEYRDYLYEMTIEACEKFEDLDGIFFDIVFNYDVCYCDACIRGMRKMGLNPDIESDAKLYYQIQKRITIDGLCSILKSIHPDASIFFNTGGAEIHMPQWHYASTHFELEDLPTVWGGYDKMPMRARFFGRKEKDYLGMTGKFHRAWGEFGGYKTPEALKYECAAMLANGARVSVGDQLHPLGKMEMETYRNIGYAYSYVEQIEEYCFDTQETAKLGVMVGLDPNKNDAIAKLLLDSQVDFDIVIDENDLNHLDTVILPDNYRLNDKMAKAFDDYVKRGGKVLLLGGGGLKEDEDTFAFTVPFVYEGKSSCDKDFFEVTEPVDDFVQAPILCYSSAHKVSGKGTIFANVHESYFNRTYGKYCSHYNTPYKPETAVYPGAILCGNIMYVAHELASMYAAYGATYHRRYFKWLLGKLYKAETIKVDMPSQGRVHLVKRIDENEYVLHLLYASPVQRGGVCILEDFPTLRNIKIELNIPEEIKQVRLMPQNETIEYERVGDTYELVLPELTLHQMIVISY